MKSIAFTIAAILVPLTLTLSTRGEGLKLHNWCKFLCHCEPTGEAIQLINKSWILSHSLRMTSVSSTVNSLPSYHPIFLPSSKRFAFTLAEVLITLGIIGVVAAVTMSTLITNIKNKGYVEKFKKTYSLISQTTNFVSEEMGIEPKFWSYSVYTDGDDNDSLNRNIMASYKKHFKIIKDYTNGTYSDYNMYIRDKLTYRYHLLLM